MPARFTRPFAIVAGLAVIGVLAGCTGSPTTAPSSAVPAPSTAPPPSADAPSSSQPSASTSASSEPTQDSSLTILQAIAAARKAEKGVVVGAELDRFGEASAWKVDIRSSRTVTFEIAVQQSDGRVLGTTSDETDDEARTAPDSDAVDAIKAAEKRVSGGQATSVELDTDGGRRVWDVKLRRPGEVPVDVVYDADSGRFIRQQSGD